MRRYIASGLVMILAMGLMLQAWVAAQEPDGVTVPPNDGVLDLYFIGKRQSQIEPCGCQTKQKGGIQYESSLYHKHPGRPVLKVDAGDWVRGRLDLVPLDALKTRYLLRAMHALGYDAINVGLNDVQNPPDFFESMREAHPGVLDALVSANIFLKSEPEKTYFPPWRIVERELEDGSKVRIGITGLTSINRNARESNQSLELGEYLLKDPVETLKAVVRELRPQVDVLVVLHTGIIPGELQLLVDAAPEVDFLVTTSNLANPAAMILRSGQTYMLSTPNNLGKEVGILSLKPGDEGRWQTAAMPTSLYVSLDLPVDEEMVALIEAFKQETRSLEVEIPSPSEMQEIYSGANSCRYCHQTAYESWSVTPHAHAFETLVTIGQHFNPECLACHVTGFRNDNGFYTPEHRPSLEMAGVQCEVCHGPAREHVVLQQQIMAGADQWKTPEEFEQMLARAKEVVPPAKVEASTCIQCHQGENDPDFNFDEMIQWVDHQGVDVPPSDNAQPAGASGAPAGHAVSATVGAAVVAPATAAAPASATTPATGQTVRRSRVTTPYTSTTF